MSIYNAAKTDAERRAAIVSLVTNAATEAGAIISSIGTKVSGPLRALDIAHALGVKAIEAERLVDAGVNAGEIVRNFNGSENSQHWTYSPAP